MGVFDIFRSASFWRGRASTTPPEQRAMSPTVAAYVYSPGQVTNGFYRKGGISFEQVAKEGYGKNEIAYASVDEVARAGSSAPWLAYQLSTQGVIARDNRTSPLARRRMQQQKRTEIEMPMVFDRPNPYQSWPQFLYWAFSFYRIAGEVPIEAITPGGPTAYDQPPTQLYLHQPDTVRPILGRLGLSAYGYIDKSGHLVPKWPVDPVTGQSNMRLIKTFNPTDPWRGLSPIEAAALSIDVHNDANTWNANLLRRGASSDLLVTSKNPMPDKSFSRLRDLFKEELGGAHNVKAVTLIDGLGDEYDIEKISFTPRDMSWIEALDTSSHRVAIVLGGSTMPFLLGLSDTMTYNNQKEARQAFWHTFVIPIQKFVFRDEFNAWLMPRYNEGMELDLDLDEVTALEPERSEKWDRLEKSTMLSLNEKRELLGFDIVNVPGADIPVGLLQYSLAQQAAAAAEEQGQTQEEKAQAFERELLASGIDAGLAKEMRAATFVNGTHKNGTVH